MAARTSMTEHRLGRTEGYALAVTGALLLALRATALFHHAIDSDEPQHLHVAWTEGLVQYRDVFDNHAPLLHLLSAPLVALMGERPDVVIRMRMVMVPLFLLTMVATFFIARRLYSLRVACWTVALVAFYPPFFMKSLEYRTDNLWTALCMIAAALFLWRRPAAAGFVLGCALGASIKTLPLVMGVVLCAAATGAGSWKRWAAPIGAFLATPVALAAFFQWHGAWRSMWYCVFEFNFLATRPERHAPLAGLLWALGLGLSTVLFVRLFRAVGDERKRDRLCVAYVVVVFVLTTQSFWPILSQRDYLAVMPLLAMFLAGEGFDRVPARISVSLSSALVLVFVASLARYTGGFRNRTADDIAAMRQALDLARPGECVMDRKGETVFRRRPFYYALESITRDAIARNRIADTIADDVVARPCHLAGPDDARYPPHARAFLKAHFLDVGALRAAGQWVRADGTFAIAVPGRYVIANARGLAPGLLDGVRLAGPVTLRAGTYRFVPVTAGQELACFWAAAYERGYSPFRP